WLAPVIAGGTVSERIDRDRYRARVAQIADQPSLVAVVVEREGIRAAERRERRIGQRVRASDIPLTSASRVPEGIERVPPRPHPQPGVVLGSTQNVYTAQSSDAGGRGSGVAFRRGGSARRKAIIARTSSSSQLEAWSQIIACQCMTRPSLAMPLRIARAISASLHAPRPVSRSGVRLRTPTVPNGRQLSLAPPAARAPWQRAHEATV